MGIALIGISITVRLCLPVYFNMGKSMKRYFHKSLVLIIYSAAVCFVFGIAINLIPQSVLQDYFDINDRRTGLALLLLTIILLVVNNTEILAFWIKGKSQEIYVKKLVGVNKERIIASILFDFNLIVVISGGIGGGLSYCAVQLLENQYGMISQVPYGILSIILYLIIENAAVLFLLNKQSMDKMWS